MNQEDQQQLTIKQAKWLKLYIDSGNATQSAMQVYDCKDEHSAAQIGYENLRKLDIAKLMEQRGLTDISLLTKLSEGLDSMKQLGARKIVRGQGLHPIRAEASSDTDDFIEVEDMPTRHKYLETALKLKGKLIDRKDITTDGEKLDHPILYIPSEDKETT